MKRILQEALQHECTGRIPQAVHCYRRVLQLLPLHALANARLGALLLRQGDAAQAIAPLQRALQGQPHAAEHWIRLAAAFIGYGDVRSATDLLSEAQEFNIAPAVLEVLSQNINEPPHARQQGLVQLYRQGNHLTTEIAVRMFIQDYPSHPLGWQLLGAVLHDTGQLDKALHIRQQTIVDFPKDVNAHNNLAYTLLALGDYAQALVSSRKALAIDPSHAAARQHEAQALAGLQPLK